MSVLQGHSATSSSFQLGHQRLDLRVSSARIPEHYQARLSRACVLSSARRLTPLHVTLMCVIIHLLLVSSTLLHPSLLIGRTYHVLLWERRVT